MKPLVSFLSGLLLGVAAFAFVQSVSTQAGESSTSFFPDIEAESYYDLPVLHLVRKGILKGYDDGRFDPSGFVTRGQVATIVHRYDREVVQPLRKQVAKLRELLELGRCGDGQIQVGEQCDDGNTIDGDGCGAECLTEKQPEPPKKIGCKVAGCSGELCVDGHAEDVVFICLWRPEHACYKYSDCERQVDGTCGWAETSGFVSCLKGLKKEAALCEEMEQDLADKIRSSRACREDTDCTVLVRGCGPFLTCGKPINTASTDTVKMAIAAYVKECPSDRYVCAACMPRSAVCDRGFCRLDPPIICSEEGKMCSDGSTVTRNPDLECDFDPCPEEPLCGNGICEPMERDGFDSGAAQFIPRTCPEDCDGGVGEEGEVIE